MQNYGQASPYQRPGSTASFGGPPPPPPPPPGYGTTPGYQSTAPAAQNQWPAPTPTQTANPWNQPQHATPGGYHPGTYGAIGGQQNPSSAQSYADQPPPPPPKPQGFAAAVQHQQQQSQNWSPQPHQNAGYSQQTQQGGYPVQTAQHTYSSAAPPPPSATPGGSYFPPAQGGRPDSMYGANMSAGYGGTPQVQSTVISPNEQQPAYIPPSLTGQGVQAYMPSNTNPAPGVYVPPPPDIPAWQQAQHAPLQGGSKKFRYTKPVVDPSFYAQGYQGTQSTHAPPLPPRQHEQVHHASTSQSVVQPQQYAQQGQQVQMQHHAPPPHNQYAAQQSQQPLYEQNQQYGQQSTQFPQQNTQQPYGLGQTQGQYYQQNTQQSVYQPETQAQPNHQSSNQWQNIPGTTPGGAKQHHSAPFGYQQSDQQQQQQQWQSGHQTQPSLAGESHIYGSAQDLQAPTPLGRTNTAPIEFFNQAPLQSQPVSPISHRESISFTPGHQSGSGHSGSMSSIALASVQAQRNENRISSPRPLVSKIPTPPPPPPRDDKSKFSALGSGGPSDWETFGAGEEIDDEEMFSSKKKESQVVEAHNTTSVELPAHVPSPPPMNGWPSPAANIAPLDTSGRRSTYAPTPPPTMEALAHPSSQQQQPNASSLPVGAHEPSAEDPRSSTQPLSTDKAFVMNDGGWEGQSMPMDDKRPVAAKPVTQPPSVTTNFEMKNATSGSTARTPTQADVDLSRESQLNELKAKDAAYEQLQAEYTLAQENLRAEIASLKGNLDMIRSELSVATQEATRAKGELSSRIQTMETAAAQAKIASETAVREKDLTLERMKEDIEGKEHNIGERDETIATLRRELDEEKAREPPRPTPSDVIPDLDPWYAASLDRYINMLRAEATEPQIEEKIKIFRAFWKSESQVRGIDFFEAPPVLPAATVPSRESAGQPTGMQSSVRSSAQAHDLNVQVPTETTTDEDDYDFSPGGRPILKRKSTLTSNENVQHHSNPSISSTTILTPASSVDEDANRTPVQSPPEEQSQPQYKAYVPPAAVTNEPISGSHRHTMSSSHAPVVITPPVASQGHDEIFFGASGLSTSKPTSRPTSSNSISPEISIPAPLSFTPNRPASAAPPSKKSPQDVLSDLLPRSLQSHKESDIIQDLRNSFVSLKPHLSDIDDVVKTWDKSASLARRKKDDARRKRQEEFEEHNDDLFNDNEISYAEMNQLEDDFRLKEGDLKAKEDRDEYKSYVESVFDPVYDGVQADIKDLMDVYVEVEAQLATSVSGIKSLEDVSAPSTLECLDLLKTLHQSMEQKHEKVVEAVAERDKRYKKTETQPLYATGNITKMKSVEKHFEKAEKQAVVRAKQEEAGRVGQLVNLAHEVVLDAVSVEQKEINSIIAAVEDMEEGSDFVELLDRAQQTITALKESSKGLLRLFNDLEVQLHTAVREAELSQAKAENADAARLQDLEAEKSAGAVKLAEDIENKVALLDKIDARELIRRKGGKVELSEEEEKEERLKAALEEAKRRNGQV